jgi:hypothetical protein
MNPVFFNSPAAALWTILQGLGPFAISVDRCALKAIEFAKAEVSSGCERESSHFAMVGDGVPTEESVHARFFPPLGL